MAPLQYYIAYLRPRSFVATWLCCVTGYALSLERPATVVGQLSDLGWLFLVYSVLLWGGTNALNSSQDRDTGPVNMLPNPPPLPPYLALFSLGVMGLGVAVAALKGWASAAVAAAAAVLSIYYSVQVPGLGPRGKAIPGIDILINSLGFGLMAVLLGYSATSAIWTLDLLWVGVAFSVMGWGGIPTSQIFQLTPVDTVATARNFSAWVGPRNVLLLGPVFFGTHLAMLILFMVTRRPDIFRHWVSLALGLGWLGCLVAAMIHSLRWARAPFENAYSRMVRHMVLVLGGQVCWTVAIWIDTTAST